MEYDRLSSTRRDGAMPTSNLNRVLDMLQEVHDFRDSDPRRARYLRDRLYATVLTMIDTEKNGMSRDKILELVRTALQCESIDIAPIPRETANR